jgi:hypothetical protein
MAAFAPMVWSLAWGCVFRRNVRDLLKMANPGDTRLFARPDSHDAPEHVEEGLHNIEIGIVESLSCG